MNIEFEKLQYACSHQSETKRCLLVAEEYKCTESNCPLKSDEKVCRWKSKNYEEYGCSYIAGCNNSPEDDDGKYCQYCGGKVVVE